MRAHAWISLFVSLSLALIGLEGCIRHKAGFCQSNGDCKEDGMICDFETMGCRQTVLADAGTDAVVDAAVDATSDAEAGANADADQAKSCAGDAACPINQNCNVSTFKCFACSQDDHCSAISGKPACDLETGLCVACTKDEICSSDGRICDLRSGSKSRNTCVGCTESAPSSGGDGGVSGDGGSVSDGSTATEAGASKPGQCPSGKPLCDERSTCIECKQSSDCRDGARPVCDTKTSACVPCFADSECTTGAGYCLPNGRCATSEQTIFVKKVATLNACPDNGTKAGGGAIVGNGTQALPYCLVANALGDLDTTKNVVVLIGLGASGGKLGRVQIVDKSFPVYVLGRGGAVVASGPSEAAGLEVRNSTVFVNGLSIKGGLTLGVLVDDGALSLNRCYVGANMGGGILVKDSSFDIENTFVVENEVGSDDLGASFSELRIQSLASGGFAKLINDTFVTKPESSPAISMKSADVGAVTTAGLLMVSAKSTNVTSSILGLCCGGASASALGLGTDYAPGASAGMCLDKVPLSEGASDDYLGNKRPGGAKSDCGALEYLPPTASAKK